MLGQQVVEIDVKQDPSVAAVGSRKSAARAPRRGMPVREHVDALTGADPILNVRFERADAACGNEVGQDLTDLRFRVVSGEQEVREEVRSCATGTAASRSEDPDGMGELRA